MPHAHEFRSMVIFLSFQHDPTNSRDPYIKVAQPPPSLILRLLNLDLRQCHFYQVFWVKNVT